MKKFHDAGFLCDFDVDPGTTMNKRVRNAQLAQYNFIFGLLFFLHALCVGVYCVGVVTTLPLFILIPCYIATKRDSNPM